MNGLSSILLSCQKFGGKSSNEWINEGVGRINGFTNKAVSGATRSLFGGSTTYSFEGQDVSYAVGGLFCKEKCKEKLDKKISEKTKKELGEKAAGSLIQSSVPVIDSKTIEAIRAGADASVKATEKANADLNKRETCTDAMAKFVIRKALDRATTAALTYINTGMGGAPYYVTDPSTYFQNMYHDILNRNINQSNIFGNNDSIYGNTTNLINSQVDQLIVGQLTGKTPNFVRNPANISGRVSTLNTFLDGAFNGGMGQYLNKIDNINRDFSTQRSYAEQELLQGRGFFSQKKCVKYATQFDVDGERICTQYEVVTPGSVIANQADEITTSQIKQLETANKISDVMANIMDSFLNDWLNNSLRRTGNDPSARVVNYPSPYANTGNLSYSSAGYGGGAVGIETGQYANGADVGSDFNISHTTVLADIMTTQNNFLYRALDSINANKKLVAQTGALDYCLPGPNPSWVTYASDSNDILNQAISSGEGFQAKPDFKNETFTTDRYGFNDPVTESAIPYKPQIFKISPANAPLVQSKQVGSGSGILDFACGLGSSIANVFGGNTSCDRSESWTEANPTPSNQVSDAFNQWFVSLGTELINRFGTPSLISSFIIADTANSEPFREPFIRGQVRAMVNQADMLVSYNQQLQENIDSYDATVSEAQNTIKQMQDVYNQTLGIVRVARARHIATQAAQGVVVNQQCLDYKYAINKNVAGSPQKETDADTDPTVIQSQLAQYDFYQKLCNTTSGAFSTNCIPPIVKPVAKVPFIASSNAPSCLEDLSITKKQIPKLENKIIALKPLEPGNYRIDVKRQIISDYYRADQTEKISDGGGIPNSFRKNPSFNLVSPGVLSLSALARYADAVTIARSPNSCTFGTCVSSTKPVYAFNPKSLPAAVAKGGLEMNWLENVSSRALLPLPVQSGYMPWAPTTGAFGYQTEGLHGSVGGMAYNKFTWLSQLWDGSGGSVPARDVQPGSDPNVVIYREDIAGGAIDPIVDTGIAGIYKTYRACHVYTYDRSRFADKRKTSIELSQNICNHSMELYVPKKIQYTVTIIDKATNQRISITTVSMPFEPFYGQDVPADYTEQGYGDLIKTGTLVRNVSGGMFLAEVHDMRGGYAKPQTTSLALCQN